MTNLLAQLTETDLKNIESNGLPGFKFAIGSGQDTIGGIVTALVPYVFAIGGIMLLFFIISGGYSWMISQGEPKAIAAAKGKITSGIIGFFILFTSYWIVILVGRVLGLTQFGTIFGQ